MAKAISNMGQRAYANVTALVGGMEDVIKKANEAAMTLQEKEAELARVRDEQVEHLKRLQKGGDITTQELANAQEYLAAELKKQSDALHATPWDKAFQDMFQLRVPMEERIKDAFDKIKEAGEKMNANADEIAKLQELERERIEKMYAFEEKRQKEKGGSTGGAFAVAGSVEAYRISMASEQSKTTKAIEKGFNEVKNEIRDVKSNQRELCNKIDVEP